MKKIVALNLAILLLISLGACGSSATTAFSGDVKPFQNASRNAFDISIMELIDSKENVAGAFVDTYTDGEYWLYEKH